MTGKVTFEEMLADDSLLETDPRRLALINAFLELEDKIFAAVAAKKKGQLDAGSLASTLEQVSQEYSAKVAVINSRFSADQFSTSE